MKKSLQALGLVVLAVLCVAIQRKVIFARLTGSIPTNADIVCFGPNGLEVCIDASANLVPTTTGVGSLGTSTYKWSALNVSGAASIGGAVTAGAAGTANGAGSGNATAPVAFTNSGIWVDAKTAIGSGSGATTGVYASTTIPVISSYETVISSGGPLLITALPNVSTTTTGPGGTTYWASGTRLVIGSTSNIGVTFQDNGTLAGSGLLLRQSSFTVSNQNFLPLEFDATDGFWHQVGSRNGN